MLKWGGGRELRSLGFAVLLAVATILCGSLANAADLYRSDNGLESANWNGTEFWSEDSPGSSLLYQNFSTGFEVALTAIGQGTLTVSAGDTANSLSVMGGNWALSSGSLALTDALNVVTSELTLDDWITLSGVDATVTGGNLVLNSTFFGFSGDITVEQGGTVTVNPGTTFSVAPTNLYLDGGTLEFNITGSSSQLVQLRAGGGTIDVGNGNTLTLGSSLTPGTNSVVLDSLGPADFTKTGAGSLDIYGNVTIGSGVATFKGGQTTFEANSSLTAGRVVVDGNGATVTMKDNSTTGTDAVEIKNGGKVQVETSAVFTKTPSITFDNGTLEILNTSGGSLNAANGSNLTVLAGGGILDIDAGIDLTHLASATITGPGDLTKQGDGIIDIASRVSLLGDSEGNGGKVTFEATTNPVLVDTISSREYIDGGNWVAGFQAAEIMAEGNLTIDNKTNDASVNATKTTVKRDLTLGAYNSSNGVATLAGGTLEVDGVYTDVANTVVKLSGQATFNYDDSRTDSGTPPQPIISTTINSSDFNSVGLETTKAGLKLGSGAKVNAGYDEVSQVPVADGIVTVAGNLDLTAGNNTLGGHNLNANGDYTDASNSHVHMTGDAVVKGETTISSQDFTVTQNLTSEGAMTLNDSANVNVGSTTAANGGTTAANGGLSLKRGTTDKTTLVTKDLNVTGGFTAETNTKTTVCNATTIIGSTSTIEGEFSTKDLRLEDAAAKGTTEVNVSSGADDFKVTGDYYGGDSSKLIAATQNLEGLQDVTLKAKAELQASKVTVNKTYEDEADSTLAVTTSLTFKQGADVKGKILGGPNLDVFSGDNSTPSDIVYKALTVDNGFNSKSITSGNLKFGTGTRGTLDLDKKPDEIPYYEIAEKLDVHGKFDDNGATTKVVSTATAPNATITGHADVRGNFTSNGLEVGGTLTLGATNTVDAGNGTITVGNLDSSAATDNGNLLKTTGTTAHLDVKGTYKDTVDSKVDIGGEFKYTGAQTINSVSFTATTLNVDDTQALTLGGKALGNATGAIVTTRSDSDVAGILILNDGSKFGNDGSSDDSTGKTVLNTGTVIVNRGTATFAGDFDNRGTLVIGEFDYETKLANAGNLNVEGNWKSNAASGPGFVVDATGNIGTLTITGTATTPNATNNVELIGETANKNLSLNLYQLGLNLKQNGDHTLVSALTADSNNPAFTMDKSNNTSKWDFELTPTPKAATGTTEWMLSAKDATVTPDVSSFFLANIIGFDLPRAQNISGPWVRMKGGHLYDDAASMSTMSFQMLQIGWDKQFDTALGNGNWFAGVFFEGDWMYGNGIYYRDQGQTNAGALRSAHRGMGTGLYVSRGFESGWYCDLLGRISLYNSKVNMIADPTKASDYHGAWVDQLFSMGLEIGKSFTSRNERFSFNPYNRLLYNSTPTNTYSIDYADAVGSTTLIHNHAVDAWTNQLGGRLYWNSVSRGANMGNFYFGADYYQGLSGRFALDSIDRQAYLLNPKKANWEKSDLARPKNNLSYGTGTLGATYLPKENISLNAQLDMLFGDVSGWATTVAFRYSY